MTPDIEWSNVAKYLAIRGHHLDLNHEPSRLGGGLANRNFRIVLNGAAAIFRCPPTGPQIPGVCDMGREHRVLTALAPHYGDAPKSLFFGEDSGIMGTQFHIMEYRDGSAVRGASCNSLKHPLNPAKITVGLSGVLVALHEIDVDLCGLAKIGRPTGFVSRTVNGWITRAEASGCDTKTRSIGRISAFLRAAMPADHPRTTLIHNDVKFDNLLFNPADGEVAAVLDWDMATLGHPLFDLATTLSYWTQPDDPDCMHQLEQMPTCCNGFGDRANFAELYRDSSGCSTEDLAFFLLLARLKLATVFRQLHARFVSGTVSDPRYAGFGKLADDLFDFAASRIGTKKL